MEDERATARRDLEQGREWQSRFELPAAYRTREGSLHYLGALHAHLSEWVARDLGAGFEAVPGEPELDFGGYWSWQVGIRRQGQLAATVTLEWNESLSPTHFQVHWERVEAPSAARRAVVGSAALAGATLGLAVSGGGALAALVLGAAGGGIGRLAWRRLIDARAEDRPLELRGVAEAIARGPQALEAAA